jgi:uncharacterized protein (TIGR00299 family) protein
MTRLKGGEARGRAREVNGPGEATNALLLDPFSGVSGDMFLAALVDLGVSFDAVREIVLADPVFRGVRAESKRVSRGVFDAVQVTVSCPPPEAHRSISDILRIIDGSSFGGGVKRGAAKTFETLAAAEAKVHGGDREAVHFHEVGALDAMFDIFAAHVALDLLGNPRCLTRPVALGSGKTSSGHGEIPLPAPAALELLAGFKLRFGEREEELVTPTGAAILASRFAPLPEEAYFVSRRIGYGAGSREGLGLPNVLRAILGTIESRPSRVSVVTTTIDDMSAEVFGYVMERLLGRGALDVYYNSVMMKKNRPGVEVTVIAEEAHVSDVVEFLMSETTTLGVRVHTEDRVELPRSRAEVETPYGKVAVKVAERPGGAETMSPEYESCRTLAEQAGVPLVEIYDAARRAWKERDES